MVEGNVTINASPKNALLGDVITFTGRLLIDGAPFQAGITIYLDTAPAPDPETLASGETDSNGYYNIEWTANYSGNLPIFAVAAAYQGFTSPTIIVGIVSADVVVYLDPPLHNALLEFRYRSYGMDELLYSQYSVLGRTAWPQGTFTLYDIYQVRFPPQTVGGVSYLEARTATFMYQNAPLVFTLNLQAAPSSLSIGVDKTSGRLGDTFTFSGVYVDGYGSPLSLYLVTLYKDGAAVGTSLTDVDGQWIVPWTATSLGSFGFYAEAPET